MHLTTAYSKIKKQNLVLINNATYQRETLSEGPIQQPLSQPCVSTIVERKNKINNKDTLKMIQSHDLVIFIHLI